MIYILEEKTFFKRGDQQWRFANANKVFQEINKAINNCLVVVTALRGLLAVSLFQNTLKPSMATGNETFVTQITKLAERRSNCLGWNDKLCRKVCTKPINFRLRLLI